ncbi:MAG: endonuclease [Candidatus Cloacimonetes bacterium]|nr:endonuclease [Candidatus Cloacimonadota bacterium]
MKRIISKYIFVLLMLTAVICLNADYYDGVTGLTGTALKSGLHTILRNTHTHEYSYSNLATQMKITDEDPNNSNNVIEIYTGWSVPKSTNGGGVTQWNKEHTWSKSHGNFGESAPAGSDLHHLRPCDATVNSFKSNRDFDIGTTTYTDPSPPAGYTTTTGCKYSGNNSFEPRDADKGDVARMIFYMAVRYEGTDTSYDLELVDYVNSSPSNQPKYGKLSTLLAWHIADPPDAWELLRNGRIQGLQGNRNPFVDHPEFVARIWGGGSSAEDDILLSIPALQISAAYPNPFVNGLSISVQAKSPAPATTTVYNLKGQRIYTAINPMIEGENKLRWSGLDASGRQAPAGVYFIRVEADKEQALTRVIKR